jgi:hypothetical protein
MYCTFNMPHFIQNQLRSFGVTDMTQQRVLVFGECMFISHLKD